MIAARKKVFALCLLAAACAVVPGAARAEQLPVRVYTSADGLGQNRVKRIVRDSRGFLWFCTADGLSRFDGYRFATYDTSSGLPYPSVNDLIETRAGAYWIASNGGGVFRFDPTAARAPADGGGGAGARPRFVVFKVGGDTRSNRVNRLFEDSAGRVWAGTDNGLFVLEGGAAEFRPAALSSGGEARGLFWAFAEDGAGTLWAGSSAGLVRGVGGGRVESFPVRPQVAGAVWDILKDGEGRLWAGHAGGLLVFKPPAASTDAGAQSRPRVPERETAGPQSLLTAGPGEARNYTTADGLVNNNVLGLLRDSDGRVWIGTEGGLSRFDGRAFSSYTTGHGLSDNLVRALGEDAAGNLWLGTETGGAVKLARRGLVTYRESDGLGGRHVVSVFEDRAGTLCVLTANGMVSYFGGGKFASLRPNVEAGVGRFVGLLNDSRGDWWLGTPRGLYRFRGLRHVSELARARPHKIYTSKDGLSADSVGRLFEDSRGDIWIAASSREAINRFDRAAEKFQRYSEGLPGASEVMSYAEDKRGAIWVGFREGGVSRHRAGRFELLTLAMGVPADEVLKVYADAAGRLWLGVNSYGLLRLDDPSAERPAFHLYSAADGLTSNVIRSIAEDEWGRLYVGTPRSVDRLEPATGRVKRFTTADGLASNETQVSYRDHAGALWFGTVNGLSRLAPEPERESAPPPVMIGGLRVAGVARPVSDLGETEIGELSLSHTQNQVQVDFLGLGFGPGEVLRYQYRLEGAGGEWGAPTDQRSVTFANLAPGSYRFAVRAVNADGVASDRPAVVSFRILPPLWQRWWFVSLVVLSAAGALYAAGRYRVARAVELERVRTRIATDLHDDIGASLSQIAILSEVVTQRVGQIGGTGPLVGTGNGDGARLSVTQPLAMIANTSREMVDSMSDIVWAINPQKDHLHDLKQRMRLFASDMLSARDIRFRFEAHGADLRLGADLRREVYLIFKECVNNLAKHSAATEADIELRSEGDRLTVRIRDNGRGFDPARAIEGGQSRGGHGLGGMRRRAEALGGTFAVESEPGKGTVVHLSVPVRGARPRRPRRGAAK